MKLRHAFHAAWMLPLALSYDHRVMDGANAARFMVDLVRALGSFPEEGVKAGQGRSGEK